VTPTRAFARYWIAGNQGQCRHDVVNGELQASLRRLAYNAAKSGVLNLTEGLARSLRSRHSCERHRPGFFIGYRTGTPHRREDGRADGARQGHHRPHSLRRFGEKSELRGAVIFLISDAASGFVTV